MAVIDVQKFLEPVSDDAPCGGNLEYDPAFGELERIAKGTPEQQMGDQVISAEEPPWRDVFSGASELLERTKDLRLAVHLTHASVNLDGLPGLAGGMGLISGLVSTYWETLYPELDEDDNNDPRTRVNPLQTLSHRSGIIPALERAPLVISKKAGKFSLRHIKLANGDVSPSEDEEIPDAALIDAAFLDCELEELTATAEAVTASAAALKELDAFLQEKAGAQSAPDLQLLGSELVSMQGILREQLTRRGVSNGADADEGAAVASPATGEIRSREDAVRLLDRLCDYFKKHEPSSPVPLLLLRAKRLVAKDFMEILRDLTPDGVSQAETIGGLNKED